MLIHNILLFNIFSNTYILNYFILQKEHNIHLQEEKSIYDEDKNAKFNIFHFKISIRIIIPLILFFKHKTFFLIKINF